MCKMLKESLRIAINALKRNINSRHCFNTIIINILESLCNLLQVYSCLPASCLLERVEWVINEISANIYSSFSTLSTVEILKVKMHIAELEAFQQQ